jgi:polysaccharide export outer membrane protein
MVQCLLRREKISVRSTVGSRSSDRSGFIARIARSWCRAALIFGVLGSVLFSAAPPSANAQSARTPASSEAAPTRLQAPQDYLLGPGDMIKISVFQNPDLTLETRVTENGTITYPLIGTVQVGGLSASAAEKRIARMLKDGAFLIDPQVTIVIDQIHGNQVAALGQFNKPGRYPLETTQTKLSDLIALAGGIAPTGSDTVIFTGTREGKPVWRQIDIGNMFVSNQMENDFYLQAGDVLYVDRFPLFYIYGEVQRPGSFRVERNMTLVQALAAGGGLTPRGTKNGVRIRRKDASGKVVELKFDLDEPVKPEDVIFVRESIF